MGGMSHPNVFTDKYEYDADDPAGYRCAANEVGRAAGGKELSLRAFELPPGEHLCPYHYEYVEEWLVVLSGQVDVRVPSGVEVVAAGGVLCFPIGAAGAHKVSNTSGEAVARILMFSSAATPAVAVYPDSDKIGVWTSDEKDDFRFHRRDGAVPYFDGEL
jgi:uncharacterized cupin superfamily protein